jgi:pimeloyl-ACP methyl ester carboxylesterase
MLSFDRRPHPGPAASEFHLDVAGTRLSGLLAQPERPEETRAVIVALHGAGLHGGYFDAGTAPGLSLLEAGSRHGFTVWAPDRPGIGASADLPDDRITLWGQAELLLEAIRAYSATFPVGAGVLLVGHSYGLKVAWTMAASPGGRAFLGVDGAGTGARYGFDWSERAQRRGPPPAAGGRGDAWGPASMYPEGTFERTALPTYPMPAVQAEEGGRWPNDLRTMAHRIRVPLRVTYGEHERLWPIDGDSLDELRSLFVSAPSFAVEIERFGGHNLSLGWAARSYHLKVLAFAESCCLSRQLG